MRLILVSPYSLAKDLKAIFQGKTLPQKHPPPCEAWSRSLCCSGAAALWVSLVCEAQVPHAQSSGTNRPSADTRVLLGRGPFACIRIVLAASFSALTTHHFVRHEEGLASTDKAPALGLPLTSCVTSGKSLPFSGLSLLICKTRESDGAVPLSAKVL